MSRPFGFKHTEETKRKIRENARLWNKGLSKETHPSVRKQSESLTNHWKIYPHPNLGKRGRKYSDETKTKMSLARRGSGNPNWKGGVTELIKGIRGLPEHYQWRKAVLERDNHTCQDCGITEVSDAHHIKSVLDYPELIFEIDNGLTLCEDCHTKHTSWQRLKGKRRKKVAKNTNRDNQES